MMILEVIFIKLRIFGIRLSRIPLLIRLHFVNRKQDRLRKRIAQLKGEIYAPQIRTP